MQATKVLVVDDRVLYRKILRDVIDALPDATTVGTAIHGENALFQVERLEPDLVLLDVEMPVMDGLTTLRELKKRKPGLKVVMVSGANRSAADMTIEALEAGAMDFIPKPNGKSPDDSRRQLKERIVPVISLVRGKDGQGRPQARGPGPARRPTPVRRPLGAVPVPAAARPKVGVTPQAKLRDRPPARFSLFAVGTSTGGPAALGKLIPLLPANFPLPVVMVQHMPPGFTRSLADQLDGRSPLEVKEGEEGMEVIKGRVIIAPGGRHMEVVPRNGRLVVKLHDGPPVRSCRPSVDVLFRSIAAQVEVPALSLVMTGMGDDGADGVEALSRRGSFNLVQDADTSVVYGMPRAVHERGLAHEVHPIDRLASRVKELAGGSGGHR